MSGWNRALATVEADNPANGHLNGAARRLDGWKQIAAHLGRDERTVRRWQTERDLPVHRAPGGRRSPVYAYADELDRWLRNQPHAVEGEEIPSPQLPALPEPERRRGPLSGRTGKLAAAGLVALLALGAAAAWFPGEREGPATAVAAGHVPAAEARALYLEAVYLWDRRTEANLLEARDLFLRAVEIDPDYADAHAGLARTYNLLRQYSIMPAAEAYALSVEAGRRAVDLDPGNAQTQAALAFAEFYGLRRLEDGIARFELARSLDPQSAAIREWYANALLHLGRFGEAMTEIEEAQRLDPAARNIVASKGLALFYNGRVDEAVAVLTQLAAREPDFLSPVMYLSFIYLAQGDHPAYLDALRTIGRLRGDPSRIAVAEAGARGLSAGGFRGMVEAMVAEEERQIAAGASLNYNLARLHALAGNAAAALAHLRPAIEAREDPVMMTAVDPAFRLILTHPEFRAALAEAGLPLVQL